MTKIRKGITGDGNVVVIGPRTPSLIGTTPIGPLTSRIRPTHIRRFGIIRIALFIGTAIIMVTMRRIIATIEVIILIGTSIVGITVGEVGIHRFHGGLTKKAMDGLKIGVREVHAA
ncbi:MAG: hypothetical protein OXL96_04180 [Candidatus Poribacteria bacterium]|nr:hypothetical protein [Candidatus Poribacteria bacterium]